MGGRVVLAFGSLDLRLLGLTCSPSGRFFYASSACIYPEGKQLDVKVEGGGLKEQDAWPAQVSAAPHIATYPFDNTSSGCWQLGVCVDSCAVTTGLLSALLVHIVSDLKAHRLSS